MPPRRSTLVWPVVVLSLAACASMQTAFAPERRLVYDIQLTAVERPASARERYGEYKLATAQNDSGVTEYTFDDDLVFIAWIPLTTQFAFVLRNKTEHSIKIVWDDAAFVDLTGSSGRVMHSGVKYTDANASQPPTVVVRRGMVDDVVVPSANVRYQSGSLYTSGWRTDPWIERPRVTEVTYMAVLDSLRAKYVGKSVQILLPLQIQDVLNEYLFTFEVKGIDVASPIAPAARSSSTSRF